MAEKGNGVAKKGDGWLRREMKERKDLRKDMGGYWLSREMHGRWMAKLVARLLVSAAALCVQIQTSLKNKKMGNKTVANTL